MYVSYLLIKLLHSRKVRIGSKDALYLATNEMTNTAVCLSKQACNIFCWLVIVLIRKTASSTLLHQSDSIKQQGG